jgi:hypothetical protein
MVKVGHDSLQFAFPLHQVAHLKESVVAILNSAKEHHISFKTPFDCSKLYGFNFPAVIARRAELKKPLSHTDSLDSTYQLSK